MAPLGWLYGGAAAARRAAYARGWLASERPPMPTLSIGNLSAGGTGKTPLLLHAIDWLERHDAQVGVLSRGYGGDEGRILEERHPRARLVENPDRRAGLRTLQQQGGAEVLLLDDGFQHLKLQRDLDVVLLDATRPFGRCLPAGLFREFPRALRQADAVVVSRTELVEPEVVTEIHRRVDAARAGLPPLPCLEGGMEARSLRCLVNGESVPVARFAGAEVRLACGIGNPQSFRRLAEGHGLRVAHFDRKPDHHAWRATDLDAWDPSVPVVVTEKDGVKLRPLLADDCPAAAGGAGASGKATARVWELRADWVFHRGLADWEDLLNRFYLPVRAARIEPLWTAHDPHGRGVR